MRDTEKNTLIEKRYQLLEQLCELKGITFCDASRQLHQATEDCCGAYRHSWEVTWLQHQVKKAQASLPA